MKFFSSLFLALSLANGAAQAQNVTIPDIQFKSYLVGSTNINTNGDTEIQVSEAAAFTGMMVCHNQTIYSLTGIEAFTGLTGLVCYNNYITNLNLSGNTALTNLDCSNNQLTNLNISSNRALTNLTCHNNQLTNLNVSQNIALMTLGCCCNQFTSLNVGNNPALIHLWCSSNQLTSLDVSNNTALLYLNCEDNQITSLDVSNNINLVHLDCDFNQITNLDVSNNMDLTYLWCRNNQLASLDVSSNTALSVLDCSNNHLTNLNIKNGNNTNLSNRIFINNPNLTCIQVDDVAYANTYFIFKDSIASYSTNCPLVGVETIADAVQVNIYPNPSSWALNIQTPEIIVSKKITDINGRLVKTEKSPNNTILIDELPIGIYFLQLITDKSIYQQKFIKE